MSGFGNYLGATLGGSYDESFVTNSYYPSRHVLLEDPSDLGNHELRDLSTDTHDTVPEAYKPNSDLLGEVPGLLSDDSVVTQVGGALSGGNALNWEIKTYKQLRDEKDALNPGALDTLSKAWSDHGETLKTESEDFKKSVRDKITGKWSGASASAAEAATEQVTKTSIYDFTPSSEAISNRLKVLKGAFEHIQDKFPTTSLGDLFKDGDFNRDTLNSGVSSFNSRYHLDSSGRLRNNSDGYVSAQDAIDEMNELERSTEAYNDAVALFNHTYNPAVQAVAEDFPNLPPAPNMEYGKPSGSPGGGGPGAGGGGGFGGGGGGLGGPKSGTPPIGTPNFKTPDLGKTPALAGIDEQGRSPITTPQAVPPGLSQGLKPALDAATKGATSGIDAATKAAQQAAQAAGKGLGKNAVPKMREGALGLGDKPAAGKGGGTGAGGAGLGKGGPGVQQPAARLSSQPTTPASGIRPTVPAASAAGMGAMGGPGMGGAPAAGQRGQDGKEHKPNKALKNRKNGSDIVGDTDAVVPVLGDSAPAEDNEPTPAPPRRRIPQRGTAWQTDPVSGATRPPQPPVPATPD
ncbi:hypothetical protein H7J88_26795 [Mycolicibacterium flavescens]|uniref:PPE family protein n=1 Tax=Mycolicibacterium flavescens TaxID=1776 RepID=A0A1E3RPP7_MYCFV|nr:hypothetical protein [Mycolicibacterium flavescens]MCV7283250.1 hypothetical protein [Mycolicibacterium flavescens]ODQ91830.1 hypothetical protein BHQ18_02930 [Mycolicibacterium flavescens]